MSNIVFIATSLDGYIAGTNHEIDWLESVPNPDNLDMGYQAHMSSIDALVMGRNTMELVANMDIDWPYDKPVFVLSNTLTRVPRELEGKVFLQKGKLEQVIKDIHAKGHRRLYIDGGKTIQHFLQQDLIDEMIITTIPILLGRGIPLFSDLDAPIAFRCTESKHFDIGISQQRYLRFRS